MIFEKTIDDKYRRWFAWRPVKLCGPNEWDRCKMLGTRERWVWLAFVWRLRTVPNNYYVLEKGR